MPRMPILAGACLLSLAATAAAPTYRVAGSIPGPDGAGWDYAQVDAAKRLLYVTHGDAVTEVDLAHGNKTRSIGSISHGHAALPVPGTATLLVTSARDNSVRLFDQRTGEQTAAIPVGEDPDAAVFDPVTRHMLVMNAHVGTASEIDVTAKRVVRTIAIKPALEEAAIGRDRTLFVNDEDANEIEVVDLATGRVRRPITLTGCDGPTGLAYDAAGDRLVSACANGKAAVVDAKARRLVALIPIGKGPDAALIDARRHVLLIPCGQDGVLEVLHLGQMVTKVATVRTERGARTGAVDPITGAVYLPTATFGPPTPGAKRPPALPGSFHFVVVQPS